MTSANTSIPIGSKTPSLSLPLLLGGLKFLYWLLFKPTSWRAYVACIDPSVKPNFTLFDLNPAQFRDRRVLRTIAISFRAVSFWVAMVVCLILAVLVRPLEDLAFGVALGVGVGLASALVADFTIGLAAGIVGGFVGGVVGGIGYGLAGVESLSGIFAHGTPAVVSLGLASCLGLGSTGVTVDALTTQSTPRSWGNRVGILMFSVLCNAGYALLFFGAYQITGGEVRGVIFGAMIVSMVGFGFGVLVGCLNRDWKPGVVLGIVFILVVAGAVTAVDKIESFRRRVAEDRPGGTVAAFPCAGRMGGLWLNAYRGAVAGGADAMIICVVYAMPYIPARFAAGPRHAARAGMLGAGGIYFIFSVFIAGSPARIGVPVAVVSTLLGLTVTFWRSVLIYPIEATWNIFVLRFDERQPAIGRSFLRWNAAFWDELQVFPQVGLEEHLLLEMERREDEARAARDELVAGRHIEAVRAAEVEMEARLLERCKDVASIRSALETLTAAQEEGPTGPLLRQFTRVSQDVKAALNQVGTGNRRLTLTVALEQLDKLIHELSKVPDESAESMTAFARRLLNIPTHSQDHQEPREADRRRFRPIAVSWRRIVAEQRTKEEANQKQEIANPYVVSVPLDEHQELFVGRAFEARLIESQILSRNKGPLLLYGQRRMGKTSLLHNLGKLLPSYIVPMFVDLQGPVTSAKSYGGFLYNVARAMVKSARRHRDLCIPVPVREELEADPNTTFDEWLDHVEDILGEKRALLEFDELEVLDREIASGKFRAEEVMGMLRHIIQHRQNINILFCSSHSLGELQNLSSYLINVQVVKIGYLNEAETRQLIDRPVKDFTLGYEPDASLRVLDVTGGHPALVQLLCYTIVALKNEQDPDDRWTVSRNDVELAILRALEQGALFIFISIQKEVGEPGQAILCFLANRGEGATVARNELAREFPRDLAATMDLLLLRDLLECNQSGYRFKVEMIRRWFASGAVPWGRETK